MKEALRFADKQSHFVYINRKVRVGTVLVFLDFLDDYEDLWAIDDFIRGRLKTRQTKLKKDRLEDTAQEVHMLRRSKSHRVVDE